MPTRLIIFDCDGVIADSEMLSAEVLLSLLAEHGLPITMGDFRSFCLGHSFPVVTARLAEHSGRELPAGFADEYYARLLDCFARKLQPTPGFAAMLDQIDLPICVATSSSPQRVAHTLSVLGLTDRFGPHVYTASQVPRGKPAPDLFLFAADRMGTRPEHVVAIEDSEPGLAAAKAAAMQVLHYTGGAHLRDATPTPSEFVRFRNWTDFPQLLKARQEGAVTP